MRSIPQISFPADAGFLFLWFRFSLVYPASLDPLCLQAVLTYGLSLHPGGVGQLATVAALRKGEGDCASAFALSFCSLL